MAQQTINNTEVSPDSLYSAATKINENFTEIYSQVAGIKNVKTIFSGALAFSASLTRYATSQSSIYTASGTQRIYLERAGTIKNLVVNGQGANTTTVDVTIMYGVNSGAASTAQAVTTGVISFTSTTPNYGADTTHSFEVVAGGWIEFRVVSGGNPGTITISCELHY